MKISLIAAIAANGVIGIQSNKSSIPGASLPLKATTPIMSYHLPEDLKYFKRTTMRKPIIMGRRTFESIGRKLPQRLNVIISGTVIKKKFHGCSVASSLDAALDLTRNHLKKLKKNDEVFIIGGGQIYQQALPRADCLYLTEIHQKHEGEKLVFFPQWDKKQWREISRKKSKDGELSYDFVVYERL